MGGGWKQNITMYLSVVHRISVKLAMLADTSAYDDDDCTHVYYIHVGV